MGLIDPPTFDVFDDSKSVIQVSSNDNIVSIDWSIDVPDETFESSKTSNVGGSMKPPPNPEMRKNINSAVLRLRLVSKKLEKDSMFSFKMLALLSNMLLPNRSMFKLRKH